VKGTDACVDHYTTDGVLNRELIFVISGVEHAGTRCNIEITEYSWETYMEAWTISGGCIRSATFSRDDVVRMHYHVRDHWDRNPQVKVTTDWDRNPQVKVTTDWDRNPQVKVTTDWDRNPQVKVTTDCGDAVLIDRVELDRVHSGNYAIIRPGNYRLGTWGSENDVGWCMSNEAGDHDAFGSTNNPAQSCPATRCFRVGTSGAYRNGCPSTPPPGSSDGMLRGTADE